MSSFTDITKISTSENSKVIEGYGGPIYGIHNGASGAYEYVGVFDLG